MTVTTLYTRERLLQFNNFVLRSRRFFNWTMGIATLLTLLSTLLVYCYDALDSTILICFFTVLGLDLVQVLLSVVLPRLNVGKSKILGMEIEYTFEETGFHYRSSGQFAKEEGTVQYAMVKRAEKQGKELYLMLNNISGNLVDLSTLSDYEEDELRKLLEKSLGTKRVKWN
ncbi:MAG: YcxB family protein [Clostridia bacterium]|nr:YcxB family protein [Clostridia bacterium]